MIGLPPPESNRRALVTIRSHARHPVLVASQWTLALLFGLSLADNVYRIPIQFSEVADIVQYVGDVPGLSSAFVLGLHASDTKLRPMRQVHTKVLLETAARIGRYHPAFRGIHAALAMLLIVAFVVAARPRTSSDVAALACALAVLVGLHTFAGLFREAYPVNHFLIVTLYGWGVLLLAQRAPGWTADLLAAACVTLALLTLESGILVAVVAVAAYVGGWRGISRHGLVMIAMLLVSYGCLRWYLGIHAPPFAEHPTGFGLAPMSTEEQLARFGDRPWLLYGYTVVSAASTVMFSQPRSGIWTLPAAWIEGSLQPWMIVHVLSSLATTGLIIWYAIQRRSDGTRGYRDPHVIVAGSVLASNALIGYAYAKEEIVALAGTFYALAAYAAARGLFGRIESSRHVRRTAAAAAVAIICMTLWATRVAGTHYILREQAFHVRNDWVAIMPPGSPAPRIKPEWIGVTLRLKSEAMAVSTWSPRAAPRWVARWLGER